GGGGGYSSLELPAGLAQSVSVESPLLSAKPEKYSQRIVVVDPITGEAQATKYTILKGPEVIQKGKTDAEGMSTRHIEDEAYELEVLVGGSEPWTVEYHDGQDRLPLAYDDEEYLQLRAASNE
ncbi:MAG: hypothetical protein KGI52_16105, partial [Burkholderiales bacterium]|nr:hypothetical protein [Burkholderiales bacterium]